MITVEVKGLNELIAKLDQLPDGLMGEIKAVIESGAKTFVARAKKAAPIDMGVLRNQITYYQTVNEKNKVGFEVVSGAEYSPFIEWGTKSRVQVPPELQEYALQFKGKGPEGGAQMIYDWCRRVGIPQNVWVFVYLSIMKKGIHPHPFFFPQVPFVKQVTEERIQAVLNSVKL